MPTDNPACQTTAFKPGDLLPSTAGPQVAVRWSADSVLTLLEDPSVTDWFKRAVCDLARRDPLDALHDAELLCALMRDRWEAVLAAAQVNPSTGEADSDGV